MRDVFINFSTLMKSEFFRGRIRETFGKNDRVLHSRRIEDEIYKETRQGRDGKLRKLEKQGKRKLPLLPQLSRDVFQSFFSMNVKQNEESSLGVPARKFSLPLLKRLMESPEYAAVRLFTEGSELPAYDATEIFMSVVSDHLDELLKAANGSKQSLDVLDRQTAAQEERLEALRGLIAQRNPAAPNPALDKKILRLANRAYGKVRQLQALDKIVEDNLLRAQDQVNAVLDAAGQAAAQKARETAETLLSWENCPGNMRADYLNGEILRRVRQNELLVQISQYLGRLREMMRVKRKNATVYGRGEKYGVKMGNQLRSVLSSEFALLAAPETTPLFLRKYQRGALLQYQRRERVCKGQGGKIVCLDESISTMDGGGVNAAWGKAVAYALLDTAAFHKRSFALIHFSDPGDFRTDIFRPGSYTSEDILASAETFLNGGTDYETPLREAVRLMESGEFRKADVVFITDGECKISEGFTAELQQKKAAMGFTITGILMDQAKPGMKFTLTPFCDEIYRVSELGGNSIADKLLSDRL